MWGKALSYSAIQNMKKSKVDLGFPIGEVWLLSLFKTMVWVVMSSVLNLSSPLLVGYLQCIFLAYKSFPQCVSCGGSKVQPRICWLKKFVHSQFLNCNHMVQYLKAHIFLISFVFFTSFWPTLGNGLGVYIWFKSHPHHWQLPQPVNKLLFNLLLFCIPRKIGQEVSSNYCMICIDTCSSDSFSFMSWQILAISWKTSFLKRIFCHKSPGNHQKKNFKTKEINKSYHN